MKGRKKGTTLANSRAEQARVNLALGNTFFLSDKLCRSCGGVEFYSKDNKCVLCKREKAKLQRVRRIILNIGNYR